MKTNRSLLVAALVIAAGFSVARPSAAQNSFGGSDPVINGTVEGTFTVLATQAAAGSSTWDITVKWLSDGAVTNDFVDKIGVAFNAGGTVDSAHNISDGTLQSIASITGGGSAAAGSPAPFTGPWTTTYLSGIDLTGTVANFADPNTAPDVPPGPTGAVNYLNTFTGQVKINGSSTVSAVEFILANDGGSTLWFGTAATPEGSSLALLLPGLIPLGMMLRKRRKA